MGQKHGAFHCDGGIHCDGGRVICPGLVEEQAGGRHFAMQAGCLVDSDPAAGQPDNVEELPLYRAVDKFEGQVVDGLANGVGRFVAADGSEYVGEWRNGRMHGTGVVRSPCGVCRPSLWANSELVRWLDEPLPPLAEDAARASEIWEPAEGARDLAAGERSCGAPGSSGGKGGNCAPMSWAVLECRQRCQAAGEAETVRIQALVVEPMGAGGAEVAPLAEVRRQPLVAGNAPRPASDGPGAQSAAAPGAAAEEYRPRLSRAPRAPHEAEGDEPQPPPEGDVAGQPVGGHDGADQQSVAEAEERLRPPASAHRRIVGPGGAGSEGAAVVAEEPPARDGQRVGGPAGAGAEAVTEAHRRCDGRRLGDAADGNADTAAGDAQEQRQPPASAPPAAVDEPGPEQSTCGPAPDEGELAHGAAA